MRIGIDARFYGTQAKGLGRYTQKLITHLESIDNKHEYVIFLRDDNWDEYHPTNPRFTKVRANYRWYTLAEQLFFPLTIRRQHLDVMHFTHFNVPLWYRGRFIVTIHDLILTKYPTQRASTLGPLLYRLKHLAYQTAIRSAIKRSQHIIAVSEYTKRDIVEHFPVEPNKISVVYEAVEPPTQEVVSDTSVLERYHIAEPYLLYVGNVYPHKNIERLLDAFEILREQGRDIRLVLVGKADYFMKRVQAVVQSKPYAHDVIFTGYVPDGELPTLYRHASVYTFPSLCEGFGLPGLEACSLGLPVVASDNSCLPEILADAAKYFDPHQPQEMAAVITEVLDDDELRERLVQAGYQRVRDFDWQRMAEQTRALYFGQ